MGLVKLQGDVQVDSLTEQDLSDYPHPPPSKLKWGSDALSDVRA